MYNVCYRYNKYELYYCYLYRSYLMSLNNIFKKSINLINYIPFLMNYLNNAKSPKIEKKNIDNIKSKPENP